MPVASAPEFVISRFVEHRNATQKRKRGPSFIGDDSEHHIKMVPHPSDGNVSLALQRELVMLVNLLDPVKRLTSRNAWRDVGFAISHATTNSPIGMQIWDAVSQKVETKYKKGELEQQWASFKVDIQDSITIRSLYYWAKEDSPLKFAMMFPPPFADPNHKVVFDDYATILKTFLHSPHTYWQVFNTLATFLRHTVGYNRETRTVFVKATDDRDNVYFVEEKLSDFRASHQNERIRWKRELELESDDEDASEDDENEETKYLTLITVLDRIKAPFLYYRRVSSRPWNPHYAASHPAA